MSVAHILADVSYLNPRQASRDFQYPNPRDIQIFGISRCPARYLGGRRTESPIDPAGPDDPGTARDRQDRKGRGEDRGEGGLVTVEISSGSGLPPPGPGRPVVPHDGRGAVVADHRGRPMVPHHDRTRGDAVVPHDGGGVRWSRTMTGGVRWSRTTGGVGMRWSRTTGGVRWSRTTGGVRWSRTTGGVRWSRTTPPAGRKPPGGPASAAAASPTATAAASVSSNMPVFIAVSPGRSRMPSGA